MRKLLLMAILVVLVCASGMIVTRGIETDSFSIESYQAIMEQNSELETLINEASKQKNSNYESAITSLKNSYKKLVSERESYEELVNLGVDRNGIPLSKIQEYEIEKIWITLGTYAEKEGVDLKLDITVNNSVSKTYDLNFTLNGTYSGIVEFIRLIQGDNTLVFKIENFKMTSSGNSSSIDDSGVSAQLTDGETNTSNSSTEEILTATFVCKDIKLNIVENATSDSDNDSSSTDSATTSTTKTDSTTTSTTKKDSTTSSATNSSR